MGATASLEATAVLSPQPHGITDDRSQTQRRRRRRGNKPSSGATDLLRFDRLPREVFSNLQGFLLGVDLFTLSHVNRLLFQALSHAPMWNARMANYDFNPAVYRQYLQETAKMRYAQGRSLKFPGVAVDSKRTGVHDRGGSVALPRIVRMFHLDPIAFDMWFCLLPPHASDDGRHVFTQSVLLAHVAKARGRDQAVLQSLVPRRAEL
jgi:hypothetical protein